MSGYLDAPLEYPSEPHGYVGRRRARKRWCHMIADTETELHAMAEVIGASGRNALRTGISTMIWCRPSGRWP